MNTNPTTQESGWRVSFWFAVSSPLIGVLLAFLAAAIFVDDRGNHEHNDNVVFVLIILLFGFDSTGQVEADRKHTYG